MPVFGVVAVMLVMVALLLAARCSNEKYVQEQDIEIVKINADGTGAWTKTIDYGNDEEMREINQMDDGSFIIAGGSSPKGAAIPMVHQIHYGIFPIPEYLN